MKFLQFVFREGAAAVLDRDGKNVNNVVTADIRLRPGEMAKADITVFCDLDIETDIESIRFYFSKYDLNGLFLMKKQLNDEIERREKA